MNASEIEDSLFAFLIMSLRKPFERISIRVRFLIDSYWIQRNINHRLLIEVSAFI